VELQMALSRSCSPNGLLRRWSLSRYVTATEMWQRVGSYPNREATISAAYGHEGDQDV
jgi:hypothetical protein